MSKNKEEHDVFAFLTAEMDNNDQQRIEYYKKEDSREMGQIAFGKANEAEKA